MLIDVCLATIRLILPPAPSVLQAGSSGACVYTRGSVTAQAASLCAGHAQQLGGESPLAYLMEVRPSDDARATAARRGLKEAWNKRASRWTKTGYKAPAPDERATYREVHIHQGREA